MMKQQEEDDGIVSKIFPQKLMDMLSDPSNHEAIAWLPHGKSFIISNRKLFSNVVLPKYFRKTKYASFTRKLNRWNFKRILKGPEAGAHYHEFFQRGKEALCTQMYCKNDRFKFATTAQTKSLSKKDKKSTDSKTNQPPSNSGAKPISQTISPAFTMSSVANSSSKNNDLSSRMMLPKQMIGANIHPAIDVRSLLARQQHMQQSTIPYGSTMPKQLQCPFPPLSLMVQKLQLEIQQQQLKIQAQRRLHLQQQIQQLQQQLAQQVKKGKDLALEIQQQQMHREERMTNQKRQQISQLQNELSILGKPNQLVPPHQPRHPSAA